MILRAPSEAEIDLVLGMMADFNRHEQIDWNPTTGEAPLRHLLANPSLGMFVVAVDQDAILGYALVSYGYDLEFGGRDAFLTELYVRPEHRQKGVGARILEALVPLARAAGVHALHLQVRPENSAARALYSRVGFKTSPRLIMTRLL